MAKLLVGKFGAISAALAFALGGCGKANDTSSTTAGVAADKPLRCEDFLSKDEAKTLGFDTNEYRELGTDGTRAVSCSIGGVTLGIFRGDRYNGAGGMKMNAADSGITVGEGPKIGADSQWGTVTGTTASNVTFVSTTGNFSANIGGVVDQPTLEKVARAVEARFEAL